MKSEIQDTNTETLVYALNQALAGDEQLDDGYLTTQDISEKTGLTTKSVRAALKTLQSQGRLLVRSVRVPRLGDGALIRIPAYKIVEAQGEQ